MSHPPAKMNVLEESLSAERNKMQRPDYITEEGIPVWTDVSDENLPCDAVHVPFTPDPDGYWATPECHHHAERRYGQYAVCGSHLQVGRGWALDDTSSAKAFDADMARLD